VPEVSLETALGEELSLAVDRRLGLMEREQIVSRIWKRDHT